MKTILTAACLAVLSTTAMAASNDASKVRFFCIAESGFKADIAAFGDDIMVKWEGDKWRPAEFKTKDDVYLITQNLPNGFSVIALGVGTNEAAFSVKNYKTGETSTIGARCFK